MTDLSDLIARVEGLEGPDRALADDVLFATGHRYSVAFLSETGWRWKGVNLTEREVPITGSLDAALALVERCLPGWELEIASEHKAEGPVWRVGLGDQMLGFDGEAPTPAMALILALLHALAAKEPS